MPKTLRDHPQRHVLSAELHARPYARLVAPLRASHLATLSGEGSTEADRAQVAALCARFGVSPPGQSENHLTVDLGPLQLKWERHTEFSTYTFFQTAGDEGEGRQPFERRALDDVPQDWLCGIPGEMIAGIHVEMEDRRRPPRGADDLRRIFKGDNYAGSLVSGGGATAWMDFAIHDDGFGRILIQDRRLGDRQGGRLVQRLLEIETYRMMALLALPVAREFGARLSAGRDRLTEINHRMLSLGGLDDERRLLAELTRLSAEIEEVAAPAVYRFGAARAYYDLVQRRVAELREERIEGLQTVDEFLERRLAPAMRTCEATAQRLERLSTRVSRASELLRTRVDIQLEAQNSDLLRSMDRRARLQLRLQETVEGLSVAAISYYLVGLVSYAAKGAKSFGLALDVDLVTGLAIPVVVCAVGLGVLRLRRHIEKSEAWRRD